MGEYVSTFGVLRQYGRGEGFDAKYDAAAKPSLGAVKAIEVTVDANGPVPNVGTGYGRDAAYLPAGAVIIDGSLLVDKKGGEEEGMGTTSNVSLVLVDKEGKNEVELMSAFTPAGDNSTSRCEGAAIGTRLAKNMYVKVSGERAKDMKAKVVIEYI